jgi:hypothetical protein
MNYTTKILLDTTTYGVPSGNYDGGNGPFFSDPVIGANYYGGQTFLQNLFIELIGFQGRIKVQASLNTSLLGAAWFEVADYDYSAEPDSQVISQTLTGNFVWIRLEVVRFEQGVIDSATVAY